MEAMYNFGPSMAPQTAFYLLQGIETLPLRMARHMENTNALLEYLTNHEQVTWVRHPHLKDHPDHELANRMLPKGASAVIAFGVAGGRDGGAAFIENVELASHLANVGDAKTLVIHPASTTHSHISEEDSPQQVEKTIKQTNHWLSSYTAQDKAVFRGHNKCAHTPIGGIMCWLPIFQATACHPVSRLRASKTWRIG